MLITSRWPKCNHFICDYMWLLIISDYFWTFLELFLVLIIFVIILIFMLPCEQHLIWFSSKKNNLCPISCKCDQFNHSPMNIQRCILFILKDIIEYIKIICTICIKYIAAILQVYSNYIIILLQIITNDIFYYYNRKFHIFY
jgi:hypothetical protein